MGYGGIYLTNTFENMKIPSYSKVAQQRLSELNLAANISSMILSLIIGPLADRFKIYKMMLVLIVILSLSGAAILVDMYHFKGQDIGWLYYSGYTAGACFYQLTDMLSVTLLAKVCSPETRGSMFGFNAMFGSVIIAIL